MRAPGDGLGSNSDRLRPFVALHERIVFGMNDVIRVVAHDLRCHAEDNFEHILPRISGGEERVDIGVRRGAASRTTIVAKRCSASSFASGKGLPSRSAAMTPASILIIFARAE